MAVVQLYSGPPHVLTVSISGDAIASQHCNAQAVLSFDSAGKNIAVYGDIVSFAPTYNQYTVQLPIALISGVYYVSVNVWINNVLDMASPHLLPDTVSVVNGLVVADAITVLDVQGINFLSIAPGGTKITIDSEGDLVPPLLSYLTSATLSMPIAAATADGFYIDWTNISMNYPIGTNIWLRWNAGFLNPDGSSHMFPIPGGHAEFGWSQSEMFDHRTEISDNFPKIGQQHRTTINYSNQQPNPHYPVTGPLDVGITMEYVSGSQNYSNAQTYFTISFVIKGLYVPL